MKDINTGLITCTDFSVKSSNFFFAKMKDIYGNKLWFDNIFLFRNTHHQEPMTSFI